ncbi:MAG: hypothetical protein EPN97_08705 [Alphaproteobacteria bacterium]|nr:MAG: hypothetical protein EPN97_08705 [Alphaproteobacteria bacterium]
MIESVSTLPVQGTALRSSPQSENVAPPSQIAAPSNFVSSRVRVDNLQNVAILEYRSSEGDVVRQYPTEAQIQAFKRAERIAEHREENVRSTQSGGHETHAAPVQNAQPTTGDIVAAAASYAPPSANASSGGSVSIEA